MSAQTLPTTSNKPQHVPEEKLMMQLGGDVDRLLSGQVDMQRLTVLDGDQEVIFHSIIKQIPNEEGGRFWGPLGVDIRNMNIAKGGRGRNDVKAGIGGRTGTSVGVEYIDKPGRIGRWFTQRDYREKAEREGKVIRE